MKRILDKLFIIVITYIVCFIATYETLRHFLLFFREWVYYFSAIFVILAFSIWFYYKTSKMKSKKGRVILNIIYTVFILVLIGNPISLFFIAFTYQPEHIVEKDNQKMVAYVSSFIDTRVYYYEYKNPFLIGYNIMEEYYGSGGFDPLENKLNNEHKVKSTIYYDKNGNIIKTENNYNNDDIENSYLKTDLPTTKERNYYSEDGKYFTNITGEKIEIISPFMAADIADEEAKSQTYQYQPWESDFYSRGKGGDESLSIELMYGLDEISRIYHWTDRWAKTDYKNRIIWKVRLFDANDPLTSLYIFIDSITGEIIGAGESSD